MEEAGAVRSMSYVLFIKSTCHKPGYHGISLYKSLKKKSGLGCGVCRAAHLLVNGFELKHENE